MFVFFFFNDTATTEIYTLSLHDALPISDSIALRVVWDDRSQSPDTAWLGHVGRVLAVLDPDEGDRKSTRLNSSHSQISYAVFCLKKKKNTIIADAELLQSTQFFLLAHLT